MGKKPASSYIKKTELPVRHHLTVSFIPVDKRRRFNVYKTSIGRRLRPIDVLQTLKRRRVSAGIKQVLHQKPAYFEI